MTFQFSKDFDKAMRRRYGEGDVPWLDSLQPTVATVCQLHSLTIERQLESYEAIVLVAVMAGVGRVVAKFGDPARVAPSIRASLVFSANGGVPVIAADETLGYLLMPYIEGGESLRHLYRVGQDDRATEIAAATIARLRHASARVHRT